MCMSPRLGATLIPNGFSSSTPSSSLSSCSSVLNYMAETRGLAWPEARDNVLSRLTTPLPLPLFLPARILEVMLARLIYMMEELLQSLRSRLPNLTSPLPDPEAVSPFAEVPSLMVDSSVGLALFYSCTHGASYVSCSGSSEIASPNSGVPCSSYPLSLRLLAPPGVANKTGAASTSSKLAYSCVAFSSGCLSDINGSYSSA